MNRWRRAFGILLIVLGVLALITPFTPGSWLIFVGAQILGWELVYAKKVAAFLHRQQEWGIGVLCFALPFVAGALGGFFTADAVVTWYPTLVQPSWTPPNWLFGPVWTLLYLFMGTAAFLVWRTRDNRRVFAVQVFFAHLVINALWSIVFFGLHATGYALEVIVILWMLIVWLIMLFKPLSRIAAWLLVPYLLWVTYATTLNLGIVLLN